MSSLIQRLRPAPKTRNAGPRTRADVESDLREAVIRRRRLEHPISLFSNMRVIDNLLDELLEMGVGKR